MKSRVTGILLWLSVIALGVAFFEFWVTSRFDLTVAFTPPTSMNEETLFQVRLQNGNTTHQHTMSSKERTLSFPNLPFGNYVFEVSLDEMPLFQEQLSFEDSFSWLRRKETLNVELTDVSSISSVDVQLQDQTLQVRWQVSNLGEFKPSGYEITVAKQSFQTRVNFWEGDLETLLAAPGNAETLDGEDGWIPVSISVLNREGMVMANVQRMLPVGMLQIQCVLPPQLEPFQTALQISGQTRQLDPYTRSTSVPVIKTWETLDVQVLYMGEPIFAEQLPVSEQKVTLELPPVPSATITEVRLQEGGYAFQAGIVSQEGFLQNWLEYFEIEHEWQGETLLATTSGSYSSASVTNAPTFRVLPRLKYGVFGRAIEYSVPATPTLQFATQSLPQGEELQVQLFCDSAATLTGRYRLDRTTWVALAPFEGSVTLVLPMSFSSIHLLEFEVQDPLGRLVRLERWIDPNTPALSFFTPEKRDTKQVELSWQPVEGYEELSLTISDGFQRRTFTPTTSRFVVPFAEIPFFGTFRAVLKGRVGEDWYTIAIQENLDPPVKN
ncbi:MAG TPA: hypothetical protein P5560_01095 [Thermotogota bacterium]|nr:hypothetical protein [Thermotogota bacterium]HRW91524.1 hypothetical protein [Thermotogota bacterium]